MSKPTALIVQKLWTNILHDDGLSYGEYVERLILLLFPKMADERSRPPFNKSGAVPSEALESLSAGRGEVRGKTNEPIS